MDGSMEAERWQRIERVFHTVLDCAPEKRAALLDSACNGNAEVRAEVESLLAAYQETGFTRSDALQDGMKLLEKRIEHVQQGRQIGPYRIVREIGRGGMGAVYLAARADEVFEKLVAIKIIRRGLDTDEVIQRFHSERKILATLDHPNITRLLDGGTTEDGLPYFVMEYIEGETIDQYCDARRLNVTERLKLFQGVCAAVRYAHQNLVIHRDLKPGNVIVTKEGIPRLLDFGIAKLLLEGASPQATVTRTRPLTPEYASPEQVRGEPITTASDVYSLGVLLYRLLTGRRPYRSPLSSTTEIEAEICHQVPEKPSLAVVRADSLAPGEAAETGATPHSGRPTLEGRPNKLRRRLTGDLDNIILMALRKEPQRRYASVEQLSLDITRHLENLPVMARPDSAGYRAAKFVARHKAGIAGATLLVMTLSAGIAATAWQAKVAAAEGKRARIEAAKAERINAFLQDMLSFSSPAYRSPNPSKNPDVKVSEAVEQAAKRAETELADQPEVLAEMQRTIGDVYYAQGHYEQAERILRAALEKYIKLYGPESHEIVEASSALGNVLVREGNNAEAEKLFRKDIEIERREAQRGHLDNRTMAYVLGDYGGMLDQQGDKAAGDYLREALPHASQFTGKDRAFVAMLYNDLGDVAYRRGDLKESERFNRAALDEYRRLPEGNYAEMGATLSNLGAVLIREGKLAEAEPFVLEGLELRRKLLGNSHPDTAMSLFRLSDLLYKEGNYPGAMSSARESVEVFRRAYPVPENNVYFANPLMELGLILNKTGRPREAESYLRQALKIRVRILPGGNLLIGTTEGALGESLTMRKRFSEAEPLLLDSYNILESTAVAHDPRTTEAAQRLITLYHSWGKPQKAAYYTASLSPSNAPPH